MTSFGAGPFDDDDALDWIDSLKPNDLFEVRRRLKSEPDRVSGCAAAVVAGFYTLELELTPVATAWIEATDTPDDLVTQDALKTAIHVRNALIETNELDDPFAQNQWDTIITTLANPGSRALAPKISIVDSGKLCALCGQTIPEAELLELSVNKLDHTTNILFSHQHCLQQALHSTVELILVRLTTQP